MKPKTFKIGQEVNLPDGTTGIFVELSEIGEMRIEGERRTWWLYPEDLGEVKSDTATGDGDNIGDCLDLQRKGE